MAQALSNDLRRRVVAAVMEGGMSRRGAAQRYGIAPSTAIKWVDAWQRTGSYRPGRQGGKAATGARNGSRRGPRRCSP